MNTTVGDQKGFPGTSVYSATKAAGRNLARTLSAELVTRGIRANALAPGPIETPLFGKLGIPAEGIPDMKAGFKEVVPMKRLVVQRKSLRPHYFWGQRVLPMS